MPLLRNAPKPPCLAIRRGTRILKGAPPLSFRVTATEAGGTGFNGCGLSLVVITGGKEPGGAAPTGTVASGAAATVSLTPVASSSLGLFAVFNAQSSTAYGAAPSSNTYTINGTSRSGTDGTNGAAYAHGLYTGTVTGGSAITIGAGTAGGASAVGAYEVQASTAGVTPVVDASTPALVYSTGAQNAQTALFSPPAGAVLAALIGSNCSVALTGYTMTDTSGLGLTWTKQAFFSSTSFGTFGIYTTTVPGGAAPPASIPDLVMAPMTGA